MIADDTAERQAVAERVYRRATDATAPIDHVGALAGDRPCPTRRSRPTGDSRRCGPGWRAATGTAPLRLLTAADLAALKPHVIVRTPREYISRLGRVDGSPSSAPSGSRTSCAGGAARDDDPVAAADPAGAVRPRPDEHGGAARSAARRAHRLDIRRAASAPASCCCSSRQRSITSRRRCAARCCCRSALALGAGGAAAVFGSGPGTSGVKVNLLGVQPVEAIRLLVVFAIAGALARRFDLLRELSEPPPRRVPGCGLVRLPRWRDVRPVVASMALVLAFFFLQKDLGPALVLSGVVIALYAIARGRLAFVFVGFGMLAAGFARGVRDRLPGRRSGSACASGPTPGTTACPAATRSRTACGRWRPARPGAVALASAVRSRFPKATPTSCSRRSASSSASSASSP